MKLPTRDSLESPKPPFVIEHARADDAASISSILATNRGDPGLYQESVRDVARSINDFCVARLRSGKIVGSAGLHLDSPHLAEVYAVAVAPEYQGQGVGWLLMQACRERARSYGVHHLWLATVKPAYFTRSGFQPISRWQLPAAVLLRKLRQTLHQPVARWLPALRGKYTFMKSTV